MTQHSHLELIGESFSPWTQKARWALEYCELAFRYTEYVPTLSEPGLRLRLRQWSGPVSVPILVGEGGPIRGSWDIACHAMELAGDGRLGAPASVEQWNTLSEAALAEGRTRVVRSIYQNNDALEESIPAVFPKRMRPWLRPVARDAVRRLDKKYAHLVVAGSLRRALEALRAALSESGTGYVLDRFTYADIAMVVVLETVAPIAHTEPPLGPATRQCWSDAALADEFADLLRWREGLVASVGLRSSQFTASRQ